MKEGYRVSLALMIVASLVFLCFVFVSAACTPITACTKINSPGNYCLAGNIADTVTTDYACIYINSSNVILNGQNYVIFHKSLLKKGGFSYAAMGIANGNGNGYGKAEIKNITITNFDLQNYTWNAIGLYNVTDAHVINNKLSLSQSGSSSGQVGMELVYLKNSEVSENELFISSLGSGNADYGLYITYGSNTNISKNIIKSDVLPRVVGGIMIGLSSSNMIVDGNTLSSLVKNNQWTGISVGSSTNVIVKNNIIPCDSPENQLGKDFVCSTSSISGSGNSFNSSKVTACASGWPVLGTDYTACKPSECFGAIMITTCTKINSPGNYCLTKDITDTNTTSYACIYINSSNVVLNGQGYTIFHKTFSKCGSFWCDTMGIANDNGNGYGKAEMRGITITNFNLQNYTWNAIGLYNVTDAHVTKNDITVTSGSSSGQVGMELVYLKNSEVSENELSILGELAGNAAYGLFVSHGINSLLLDNNIKNRMSSKAVGGIFVGLSSSKVVVDGNTLSSLVQNSQWAGISVGGSTNITVKNNVIPCNSQIGKDFVCSTSSISGSGNSFNSSKVTACASGWPVLGTDYSDCVNQKCPQGTMRCKDGTCQATCPEDPACTVNGICDSGESCNCPDCNGYNDGCVEPLVCSLPTETCQPCTTGTTYNPETKKCEDTTGPPSGGGGGGSGGVRSCSYYTSQGQAVCESESSWTSEIKSLVQENLLIGRSCFEDFKPVAGKTGCKTKIQCGCKYNTSTGICKEANWKVDTPAGCDGAGLQPLCEMTTATQGDCAAEGVYEYTVNWTGTWNGALGDPQEAYCLGGERSIACPGKTAVPFFSLQNLIIVILIIVIIYIVYWMLKHSKKGRHSGALNLAKPKARKKKRI
ncbi:MAG: right-handed parallel beta-helix repeat-containing protein [Candidatus Pacearchaeota archaeon]|jgi:hypothetical protein